VAALVLDGLTWSSCAAPRAMWCPGCGRWGADACGDGIDEVRCGRVRATAGDHRPAHGAGREVQAGACGGPGCAAPVTCARALGGVSGGGPGWCVCCRGSCVRRRACVWG